MYLTNLLCWLCTGIAKQREVVTMGSEYTVRLATPDDAAILSAVATRTFEYMVHTRLKGKITPEDLALHLSSSYAVEKMREEIEDPARVAIFVFPKGDPVTPCGYAMLKDGSIRPGDEAAAKSEDHLEIMRVYVDAEYHGKGAAHVLMSRAMELIKPKRRKIVWLGMATWNDQALKFYQKYDFQVSGTKQFQLGGTSHLNTVLTLQQPHDNNVDS